MMQQLNPDDDAGAPEPDRPRRKGVLAIPTVLTVLNVFFGFMAILYAVKASQANVLGDTAFAAKLFSRACWSLVVAAVFDTFDGLVARLMKATTEFGKEYDSLADVVTFGAAPAVLVYCWALHLLKGGLGGGIAFLFLVAGSLRLARFNIQSGSTDHRYFAGLPIPAGALSLAAIINYAPQPVTDRAFAIVIAVVTICLAFAMVSTIRYRSQKFKNVQRRLPAPAVLVFALIVAIFWRWPQEFMFIFGVFYVSSGPIAKLWSIAMPKNPEDEAPAPAATSS